MNILYDMVYRIYYGWTDYHPDRMQSRVTIVVSVIVVEKTIQYLPPKCSIVK